VWLKLTRADNVINAYTRTAIGNAWTLVGRQTIALPYSVHVGFAVSSHVEGKLATATFDRITLDRFPILTGYVNIGSPVEIGPTSDGVNITFSGSGADIWGTADAFNYNTDVVTGDSTITARVRSITNTHPWAKAGVMFREDVTVDSKHVMLIVSPEKGLAMQYRSATGGLSRNVAVRPGAAPAWVRLARRGNTFTGYTSADGLTWTMFGRVSITMNLQINVGLAVTSHNESALATAVFDDVSIRP
jgi:regulation of enolase protein 1 (concanavalin A-like superfamily)